MTDRTIRPAYNRWPVHNRRLRDAVAALTGEQRAARVIAPASGGSAQLARRARHTSLGAAVPAPRDVRGGPMHHAIPPSGIV
jgi:hypothetical protein